MSATEERPKMVRAVYYDTKIISELLLRIEDAKKEQPYMNESLGYLIDCDRERVIIARDLVQDMGEEIERVRDILVIPNKTIVAVERLTERLTKE